ncbi:hypothetical protein [Chelatococcus asaccharovorans]|uniref:Uncharacterized protein n=1 Tax=Chelatococcus asaccharovorans TaxID=28210 RepID=A0A2V3U6V6_9HYPH|nr:hypothetical protein [Chelatococcus asaccharovorans]MBS7704088.1 hypothetical protein [Chelatococcus asaccharovorans]PXW58254.1 hypothetical protein C7450_106436 [Chelatococcus asaccharovorans]CAH1666316.1 conserved hypothetical protein [Chelatococcus asaccharovorans]CAH1681544.1 conserved hypothetical protein [Chelatococcus asaccharovorans]
MQGYDRFRAGSIQFTRLKRWQVWLAVAVAATLILTLAVVAASAFLIIFPIVLVAGFLYRLAVRFGLVGRGRATRKAEPDIIDGEYMIITDDLRERLPPHDDRR